MKPENNFPPPYRCKYCGSPSWIEPANQYPPPDYCHPEDHGSFDDYRDNLEVSA